MRTVSVAVLVLLAPALASCGSTIKPDGAAQSVIDLVSEQTGFTPTDVTCPEGVEAEVGTTFECTFTGPEDAQYTAELRITKVEGDDVQFYIETHPS